MCDTHQSFLAFVDDLLEEVSLLDVDDLAKHAIVRKEIHRRTRSVLVSKLGTIQVMKNCCGKKSCVSSYEITNLKKVRKVSDVNFSRPEIELPVVENAALLKVLKTKERLRSFEENDLSKIIHFDSWIYARLFRVIDGDTLLLGLDLGDTSLKISLRVARVDCPETKRTTTLEIKAGQAAKKYVEKLYDGTVIIRVKLTALDKWGGRWVGYAEVPSCEPARTCECGCGARGNCLTSLLLSKGFAKCYEGKKKEEWTESELKKIACL